MGTTTLLVLRQKLQTAIGDKNQAYADSYTDAINNANRETYPNLHKRLEDKTLITGNILPNAHFEDQTTAGTPDLYTLSGATGEAETSTIHGGAKSVKLTDGGAGTGYMYITSNDYPRLLDSKGETITFKCWANPHAANKATLTVHWVESDGSTDSASSTTSCPAGIFTLLEIENQAIPDDIVEIQFQFKVTEASDYGYFDNARVIGSNLNEYMLPLDFQNGSLLQVYIQTSGYSDDICDDLQPRTWEKIFSWRTIPDSTYRYLKLAQLYTTNRQIRLIGYCPLETLTADISTISLDDEKQLNLLIAYAAYLLFEMEIGVPASGDTSRVEGLANKWLAKYYRLLPHSRMGIPSPTMKIAEW